MSLQIQIKADKAKFTLKERSDIANMLKAPYTVFVKKHNDKEYSWIIYSLGRPQNIVWGMAIMKGNITVEYGCRYKSIKVINDMLAIKKRDGYHLVATLARDRATTTTLGMLILSAYQRGIDLRTANGNTMSYHNLDLALLDICDQYGFNYAPDKCDLVKASETLAERLMENPNRATKYPSPIPDSVVNAILDFIAHTPDLNNQMVTICYSIDDCKNNSSKECGLYHPLQEDELL